MIISNCFLVSGGGRQVVAYGGPSDAVLAKVECMHGVVFRFCKLVVVNNLCAMDRAPGF
jgi:hypothetical protein